MPTFKGSIAFDPSDAIPLGKISPLEPVSRDEEPAGWYTTLDNPQTYEAYPGRRFQVLNFIYQSNPLDLEGFEPDPETGILQRTFSFVLDVVWLKNQFFEVGKTRIGFDIIVVGSDNDKGANTDSSFYLNANRSEELNRIFRPDFPDLDSDEAASVIGYVVDIGLSPNAKRQLPSKSLRASVLISGNFQGRRWDGTRTAINEAVGRSTASANPREAVFLDTFLDQFADDAFFGQGVVFLPAIKTGIQIANADTKINIEYSISKDDIDNSLILDNAIGVPIFLGRGIGKIVCVTREPINPPGYQVAKIGYGISDPWDGYPNGGIDGEYVKSAKPLHFTVQPESAIDDFFLGALNAKIIRVGGNPEPDIFLNCPRFSYTRVLNNFGIVYIPKEEVKIGFTFYITAHVAEDVSLFFSRLDGNNIIVNNTGISKSTGDFVFSPHEYFVRSDFLIKNWIKGRELSGNSNFLESDPLADIPPFSSTVVSSSSSILPYKKIIDRIRPQSPVEDSSVSSFSGMRLAKVKIDSFAPIAERFPLGYFAAADKFAINPEGTEYIDGGIAYISSLGDVEILVPKSAIRDRNWFDTSFSNLIINPIVDASYSFRSANDNGFISLYYDLSPVVNSLVPDNDKIPYDHRFALAISQLSRFAPDDPESGVGICALNLLERRESGEWVVSQSDMIRNAPPLNDNENIRMYYDLSNAYFDFDSPMPRSMSLRFIYAQVGIRVGESSVPGSLTVEAEWNPISPVDLKFNGRIYFEKAEPISLSTGGNSELNVPYIATVGASGKISSCIDYKGINGALVSTGSFGSSELRSIAIDGYFDAERRKSYVGDISFNSPDLRTDIQDLTRPHWYGRSVDKVPLIPSGCPVIRERNDQGLISENPNLNVQTKKITSTIGRRNISFNDYVDGVWSRKTRPEGFATFNMPSSSLIEKINVTFKGKIKQPISSANNFVHASFSSSGVGLSGAGVVLFNSVNIQEDRIVVNIDVPYYGGSATIFGGILDFFDGESADANLYFVSQNTLEKYKIDASDASVAITSSGRTIIAACVNNSAGASVDIFINDDGNFLWKHIDRIIPIFAGESISSVSIRSAHNANKLFVCFEMKNCIFIKSIENDWIEPATFSGLLVQKRSLALPDGSFYGLSGENYFKFKNRSSQSEASDEDVRSSFISNRIRIMPSYFVHGDNKAFLDEEKAHFLNSRKFVNQIRSGDDIYARFDINDDYKSDDPDLKSLYSFTSSGLFSFEVLPDGNIIFACIKEGGIFIKVSGDEGRTWRSPFSMFPGGVSCRPIKLLKSDRGSSVKESNGKKTYVSGLCPEIDYVSTAIDHYGQKMALCYSARGMLFLQELPIPVLMHDAKKDFYRVFTTDQRESIVYGVSVIPTILAGSFPENLRDPLYNGLCDFTWKIDGPASRSNFSSLSNISMGGKAPSMIYLANGVLRVHFEGSNGEIRALSVTDSTVRGDHIP